MTRKMARRRLAVATLILAAVAVLAAIVTTRPRTVGFMLTNSSTRILDGVSITYAGDRAFVGRLSPGETFRGTIRPARGAPESLLWVFMRKDSSADGPDPKPGVAMVKERTSAMVGFPPDRPAVALEIKIKDPASTSPTAGAVTIDVTHRAEFQPAEIIDDLVHLRMPVRTISAPRITVQD